MKSPTTTITTNLSLPEADSSKTDHFFWSYTEEPHRTRRQAIIKAHPEVLLVRISLARRAFCWQKAYTQVTKLCGPEPLTKYCVAIVIALQLICATTLRNTPVFSPLFILTAYIIGATANQNLFLAIHEISHNLAFKAPLANRLLAVLANIPIGLPYSAAFRVSVRKNWLLCPWCR